MRVAMVYANTAAAVGRGAGLVAASVMRAGHDLEWFDTYYTPWDEAAERIAAGGYDALLVSAMTMTFADALDLVRRVKARADIPVLVGGLHATIERSALLEQHPEIDYACVGEGESFVVEFLERLGSPELAETANLVFREGGAVLANPPRPAEDLAQLPDFPWHLFPETSIIHGKEKFLYVNASRGCPFNCTYCCNGVYLRLYGKSYLRFRPVADVVREVESLRERYRPRAFYFEDEMLFFNKETATTLFEALHALGVVTAAMARVEALDEELVSSLARNGLRYMAVGVECGDESFRKDHLNRRMSNEQIEGAIALLKRYGVYTKTYNMIGYPYPFDEELTERTLELTRRMAPDAAQFTIFYPFPGTKLYAHCRTEDLIDPEKVAAARNYYEDSVLRDVSLAETRERLDAEFNTDAQTYEMRRALSDGSLRARYQTARAWMGWKRRRLAERVAGSKKAS